MSDRATNALTNVGLAVVAGAVGFAAGLLMAPASGRETRRRLGRRMDEESEALRRRGERVVEDAKEYVGEKLEGGIKRVERALGR